MDKSRLQMSLMQKSDGVCYLCIYTHWVCYLLNYIKGLLEVSEPNVSPGSFVLVRVVGILTWQSFALQSREVRADERVKYGNEIQKYSGNPAKVFGDKLF